MAANIVATKAGIRHAQRSITCHFISLAEAAVDGIDSHLSVGNLRCSQAVTPQRTVLRVENAVLVPRVVPSHSSESPTSVVARARISASSTSSLAFGKQVCFPNT